MLWTGHCLCLLCRPRTPSTQWRLLLCIRLAHTVYMSLLDQNLRQLYRLHTPCKLCHQRRSHGQLHTGHTKLLDFHPSRQALQHSLDTRWTQAPHVYLLGTRDSHGKYIPMQQCTQLGLLHYLIQWLQQHTWQLLRCQTGQSLHSSLRQSHKVWLDLSQHHDILLGIEYIRLPQMRHSTRSGKLRMV